MFTDVAQLPGPHSFSDQLAPRFDHGLCSLQLPPRQLRLPRNGQQDTNALHETSFRENMQKPQQYARPIVRVMPTSTYNMGQRSQLHTSNMPEHMLRRKTPQGTLAAGYDGTPVEWSAGQHTVKHLLMPISGGGPARHLTPSNGLARYGSLQQHSKQQHSFFSSGEDLSQGTVRERTSATGQRTTQDITRDKACPVEADSFLHQGSVSQQYYRAMCSQQVPTVLQPMWPPCLGPTALAGHGPYGPYWPDGAYEPYRPASSRDPRYCVQKASRTPGQSFTTPQQPADIYGTWFQDGLNPLRLDSSTQTPILSMDIESSGAPSYPPIAPLAEQIAQTAGHENYRTDFDFQAPPTGRSRVDSTWDQKALIGDAWRRGVEIPSDPHPDSLIAYGVPKSHAGNAQFKEKVLVWAHRIYVGLLASIQQSRRKAQGRHDHDERQQSKINVFPKPPRPLVDTHKGANLQSAQFFTPTGTSQNGKNNTTSLDCFQDDHRKGFGDGYNRGARSPHVLQGHTSANAMGHGQGQHTIASQSMPSHSSFQRGHRNQVRTFSSQFSQDQMSVSPEMAAATALEMLGRLCQESCWAWIDGMLLGGCLAYGLGDYDRAMKWYHKVLDLDSNNVEAISNLAATLLSLNRRQEAEDYWRRSIELRPSYFEAVEHLVGLLCGDHRGKEAVQIINSVENALRNGRANNPFVYPEHVGTNRWRTSMSSAPASARSEFSSSDVGEGIDTYLTRGDKTWRISRYGSSGYSIPGSDNGRMLALVHAKGNMLYALGDNAEAAKAFEDAILIGAGQRQNGIGGLIDRIVSVFLDDAAPIDVSSSTKTTKDPILLVPEVAIKTARLVFPPTGDLPGLQDVPTDVAKRAAIATASNSLLSLAKMYQDGMSTSGTAAIGSKTSSGVQGILALYYLSLSLQPSPSTANNVGILLASVQQSTPAKSSLAYNSSHTQTIPGVAPGSGIALALAYYNYGLNLDSCHAHLYTNLGSLFKDIGQLSFAIKMYEKAVDCDPKFDIALANLANAVKDQGRISDAIVFYERAVASNSDFAEAVCGLANALNSVCCWTGRGGVVCRGEKRDRWHVDEEGMLFDAKKSNVVSSGWIERVVAIVERQLKEGVHWGNGSLRSIDVNRLLSHLVPTSHRQIRDDHVLERIERALQDCTDRPWEGAAIVRLVERATKRLGWQLYQEKHISQSQHRSASYARPQLPAALTVPTAPTVLPFHTFTSPLSAKQIRAISQRNGLRISCSTLKAPWLPATIFEPPAPPSPCLKVGYVSSDFNNHPLAHLMQSVFGFHDPDRVQAHCYATTPSDNSVHRQQIECEAPVFYDASLWSIDRLVSQIVEDGIHILVNLNGYTRGARNEVFAARPAPIQMSFMGFAGTLGAEWCDYLLADEMAIPTKTLRPWRRNVDLIDQTRDANYSDEDHWVYGENIIYTRDTFFCCDHRQSAPDSQESQLDWADEQQRRWKMRKELFPNLPDDTIILGNFNQLYKIDPTTFRTWLRVLCSVKNAILWLLRFPDLGEKNLKQTALLWASADVASRIVFTDVAPKDQHISRARVCDLFLDTPECNAHTTAADVLWSGTPLLTLPRYEYKMCSRMAASILKGALPKEKEGEKAAKELVVSSDEEYEEHAIRLANGLSYKTNEQGEVKGRGRLMELRKLLYESRWTSALFDTRRWVRDLEEAYEKAWGRWVDGEGGDIWL